MSCSLSTFPFRDPSIGPTWSASLQPRLSSAHAASIAGSFPLNMCVTIEPPVRCDTYHAIGVPPFIVVFAQSTTLLLPAGPRAVASGNRVFIGDLRRVDVFLGAV